MNGAPAPDLTYQLAYAAHYISQNFEPDNVGELLYQGVASTAFHSDLDNTLQGDLTYKLGNHTLGGGFYLGEYGVEADDNSLVFKVDPAGDQLGPPLLAGSRDQQRQQDQSAVGNLPAGHLANHREAPRQLLVFAGIA